MTDRVGFIGLGSQGAPMAQRIIAAGIPMTVWARRPETLTGFHGSAAEIASSPTDLAERSDVVCLCVMNDADVEQVAAEVLPAMASGAVLVVHSTVHPSTCTSLAQRAEEHGVTVIDAPVSGGGAAAAEGRLEVMVGADEDTFNRCRPIFAAYGESIVRVGPVGTGQMIKLVNNVLFMAQVTLAEDAFTLAESLGIARADLAQIVGHGSGNSFAFGVMATMGSMQRYGEVAGPLRKDVDIVGEVAASRGAPAGWLVDVANDGLVRCGLAPSPEH